MSTESVWRNLLIGYRKKHALTQADAATRLNVSQQTISRWESGKQEPDADAQAKLRQALGILALTTRESWIQRIKLSAGRECLLEQGWRIIAVSEKVANADIPMTGKLLGHSLGQVAFLSPVFAPLQATKIFAGATKLVRIKVDIDLVDRSVGRVFDFWPVLTGTDEILVHAIAYLCPASGRAAGLPGVRVLECQEVPANEPGAASRRRA